MTPHAELAALRAGLERRKRDARRAPCLAPDLTRIREEIARLEREIRARKERSHR